MVCTTNLDWFDDDKCASYVILLGKTFLRQGVLPIDVDDMRASFYLKGSRLSGSVIDVSVTHML